MVPIRGAAGDNAPTVDKNLRGYFGGELIPYGTNGRELADGKSPVVSTDLKGYFAGESCLYGTNDGGPAGAKAQNVGSKSMGYFGREPVQLVFYQNKVPNMIEYFSPNEVPYGKWYFSASKVPYGKGYFSATWEGALLSKYHICGKKVKGVFWGRVVPMWYQ